VTSPGIAVAVAAGMMDELADDVRDDLAQIKAAVAAPALNHVALDTYAALLEARLSPRLALLEERAMSLETRLAGITAQLSLIARQQQRTRRVRR
jgi:hypothetical protein